MGKTVNRKAKTAKKETAKAMAIIQVQGTAGHPQDANSAHSAKKERKIAYKRLPEGYKARESEERKNDLRNRIEIKRLLNAVNKAKDILEGKDTEPVDKSKRPPDSLYDLKGAARVAREYYPDPNAVKPVVKPNLMKDYEGRLWDVPEGRKFLKASLDYATALYNLQQKYHDATQLFEELLTLDPLDHVGTKDQLLRMHLDRGDAVAARVLMYERFPDNKSVCFVYSRALIEYISWSLEDEGTTAEMRDQVMAKAVAANPFAIWLLAYHQFYSEILDDENTDHLKDDDVYKALVKEGSLEAAIVYFKYDLELWDETDGTIEYLRNYLVQAELEPPSVAGEEDDEAEEAEEEEEAPELVPVAPVVVAPVNKKENKNKQPELKFVEVVDDEEGFYYDKESIRDLHLMYKDMFMTGVEAIEELLTGK